MRRVENILEFNWPQLLPYETDIAVQQYKVAQVKLKNGLICEKLPDLHSNMRNSSTRLFK